MIIGVQFISSRTEEAIFKWAVFSASSFLSLFKILQIVKSKNIFVCNNIRYDLELVSKVKEKKRSLKRALSNSAPIPTHPHPPSLISTHPTHPKYIPSHPHPPKIFPHPPPFTPTHVK